MKKQHSFSTADPLVRTAVFKSFQGKCFYTGSILSNDNFHIDHFIPAAKGGKDLFENYVLCRPDINISKSDVFKPDVPAFKGTLFLLQSKYGPASLKYYREQLKSRSASPKYKQESLNVRLEKAQKDIDDHIFKTIMSLKRLLVTERILAKYMDSAEHHKTHRYSSVYLAFPECFTDACREKYMDYLFENRKICLKLPNVNRAELLDAVTKEGKEYLDTFGIRITTSVEIPPKDSGQKCVSDERNISPSLLERAFSRINHAKIPVKTRDNLINMILKVNRSGL